MADFKSLDDIFKDPAFQSLVEPLKPKQKVVSDPEIEKFLEINEWVRGHDGQEPQKTRDVKERSLASRLLGIRKNPEKINKLKSYDEFDLLDTSQLVSSTEMPKTPASIDEILADQTLFQNRSTTEESLFDVSRYKKTIQARERDRIRTRKRMADFEKYKPLFEAVHSDLSSGKRELRLSSAIKEKQIRQGMFYVDNGIMVYVASKSADFIDKNGYTNAELHLVYENGTGNKQALLRSFVSNLHDSTRSGRMVTEVIDDVMNGTSAAPSITTGYIYIVKSLSKNPQISGLKNLYKIGYTYENVHKRIANADREPTYLCAPVQLVSTFEIHNFSAKDLEKTVHHYFADRQLDVELTAPNGESYHPKEWFLVSLSEIEELMSRIDLNLKNSSSD